MVHVCYGPDTFRSREAFRAARAEAERRAGAPVVVLRDDALTPQAFAAAVSGQPLFGPPPPLAVERLCAFTGSAAETVGAALRAVPRARTLLVWEAGEPAANGIVWRTLQAVGKQERFAVLERPAMIRWAVERAAAAGRELTREAAAALADLSGANLWMVSAELEKLLLGAPRGPITAEAVGDAVATEVRADLFPTVRALAHGPPAEAVRRLTAYRRSGEDPRRLFFLVLRELQLLLHVRAQLDAGQSLDGWAVVRSFRLPKEAADALLATARVTTTPTLRALFDRAVVAYYHLNTGRAEAAEVLETLVLARAAG